MKKIALIILFLSSISLASEPDREYRGLLRNETKRFDMICPPKFQCTMLYAPYDEKHGAKLDCSTEVNDKPKNYAHKYCAASFVNSSNEIITLRLVVKNNNKEYVQGELWSKSDL